MFESSHASFGHDIAKSMIVGEFGTHFDPDIVQAFLANEERIMEIRERFSEAQSLAA